MVLLIGYGLQTGDVKFVQNVVGHINISTTALYADHISEEEEPLVCPNYS